jgi:hypothetical protein
MTVKARMICSVVEDFGTARKVKMHPVYSNDKNSPNYSYSQATPQGACELYISNPAAFEQFKPGQTYDFVINEYVAPEATI